MIKINMNEWIEKFNNGDFNKKKIDIQIDAGWFDWNCKDGQLRDKTIYMGNIIKNIKDSKFDSQDMHIWFKNHRAYDELNISGADGQLIYSINIDDADNFKFVVYGWDNNFDELLFECNNENELIEWFNN